MKTKLTLQEKLRDLRDERKLKLQKIADATGRPLTTIQRIEVDALSLSDSAIEVHINKKLMSDMNAKNAICKLAETTTKIHLQGYWKVFDNKQYRMKMYSTFSDTQPCILNNKVMMQQVVIERNRKLNENAKS